MIKKKKEKIINAIKSKGLIFFLILIVLLAGIFSFMNLKYFAQLPWKNTLTFKHPRAVVESDNGMMAVVDSFGSRVILSKNGEIQSVISNSFFSTLSPNEIEAIALDSENIYLLDVYTSKSDANIIGNRILVYNHQGDYVQTILTNYFSEDSDQNIYITDLSVFQGKIIIAGYDILNPKKVVISEIVNSEMVGRHCFIVPECDVYGVTYEPEGDVTTILKQNGTIDTWQGETQVLSNLKPSDSHFEKAKTFKDSSLFVLDDNQHSISSYHGQWKEEISSVVALDFSCWNNHILTADYNTQEIIILDRSLSQEKRITEFSFSIQNRMMTTISWLAFGVGTIALFILVFLLLKSIVLAIRNINHFDDKKEIIDKKYDPDRPITTKDIYGPIFGIVTFVVIIMTIFLGIYFYKEKMADVKTDLREKAACIYNLSSDQIGEKLSQINSDADYGNESYNDIKKTFYAISIDMDDEKTTTDRNILLYRVFPDSNRVMTVINDSSNCRIGYFISEETIIYPEFFSALQKAQNGEWVDFSMQYIVGCSDYYVFLPVLDQHEQVVGIVGTFLSENEAAAAILKQLSVVFLEVITLIAGLTLLLAEGRLLKEFFKLKKEREKEGITGTLIEIDRPLRILIRLPGAVALLFLTLLTNRILDATGQGGNALLLALPMTIQSLCFGAFGTFFSVIAKYHPKRYMYLGIYVATAGGLILLASVFLTQYVLLIIGAAMIGAGNSMTISAEKTLRMSGKMPAKRYSLLVYSGIESGVATAIGASLGAVVSSIFGDMALVFYIIVLNLSAIPLISIFVSDDLAVKPDPEKKHHHLVSHFKNQLILFRQPSFFAFLLFVLIPITMMQKFKTFVMPLYNKSAGYPDVLIGTITFVIEMATLFLVPTIINKVSKKTGLTWAICGMGLLSFACLLFGVTENMKSFLILLFCIAILYPIIQVKQDLLLIKESANVGINPNDVTLLGASTAIADYFSPIVLSFMMLNGIPNLGYLWGGICAVCAIAVYLMSTQQLNKLRKSQ